MSFQYYLLYNLLNYVFKKIKQILKFGLWTEHQS
jgi:hypothetical protein